MVGILTNILKRKRLLPAKSLSFTLSNVPPMSGKTSHSQVPGNVGSTPSNLQGIACVKNDELKMHLAVLEGVCLGVLKVHIKHALRLAEHLPIHLQGMNRACLPTATTLADRALSGAGIHIPWGGRYSLCLLRQHTY